MVTGGLGRVGRVEEVEAARSELTQLHLGIIFKTPELQVTGSALHAAGFGRQIKGHALGWQSQWAGLCGVAA